VTARTLLATGALFAAVVAAAEGRMVEGGKHQTIVLEAGKPIEHSLSGGDQHTYEIALTAGDYAHVTVEQHGIDVIVAVLAADGSSVLEFQNETGYVGTERAELVADASGPSILAVKAALPGGPTGSYVIRLDETHPATSTDRSMHDARTRRTRALTLLKASRYDEARPLLEHALAVTEKLRGSNDVEVGNVLAELGNLFLIKLDNANAERSLLRSLTILEKTMGEQHPRTAAVWNWLAVQYSHTARRMEAEKLLQRALEVSEKILGPDHPQVAECLLSLANLRYDAGDLDKAEELERRALAVVEKGRGTRSLLYANVLGNLGLVYVHRLDIDGADELFRRALPIARAAGGEDAPVVATTWMNLGIVARQRKDYATAEEYCLRSLAIKQRILGPDHPDIAGNLNNLALIYRDKGDVAMSLDTHFKALRLWEVEGGPYHGGTLLSLGNIARTYASIGDMANAIRFQNRADAVIETELMLNLGTGSERQKLAFAEAMSERTDRTVSLNVDGAPGNLEASALAALVLLQRKGRVLDAMADTLGSLRQRAASTSEQDLLDQLKTTTARLAGVALNGRQGMTADEHQQAIRELEGTKETLEALISEKSAQFRAQSRTVTLERVQSAIPEDAALIEFAVFRPFDPKVTINSKAYGEPHYGAYVIRRDAPPRGKDLGPATAIDDAVAALRQALRDPRNGDLKARARAVDEKVMLPLRESMGDAMRLLISPDGELNLIPFEALVDQQGRYLVEQYSISYLTSGRDLLRMQVARPSRQGPVVIADPLFGEPAHWEEDRGKVRTGSARRSVTTSQDLSTVYFAPLAGTAQEARTIHALFPESTVLTRERATKSALTALDAPSILHIASHGFFLDDATGDRIGPAAGTRSISASARIENPLLRSGLALAGANLNKGPNEDGILTALEASHLNLWGTRLVTLSACDTGVGEVRDGEGVYGLRRAFFLAGAETLVMSLWPVSDYVTREMMTAYYGGLKKGLGRGDALRQAQLAMLRRTDRQHPFYWASFIQAGDWVSLSGRRENGS
jgi:CHAT domain-containing protein/Tfp pilus assembly protein PilF